MLNIRPVTEEDHTALSVLLVSTFGQPNESNLVKALRTAECVAFEFLAENEDGIVGHVCLSKLRSPQNWLTLAPICVRIESQNRGIGRELISYALDEARRIDADAVVVVGDPAYYERFGFVFDGPSDLTTPYPTQFTGLYPIAPETAAISAVLSYPIPFKEA